MAKFLQGDVSVVNAKWFGAKGDGVTDDTNALEKAVVAARGRTLFIPRGKYKLLRALGIDPNYPTIIMGEGQNVYNNTDFGGTVLSWEASVYGFYCINTSALEGLHQVVITNIAMFGNDIAATGVRAEHFHNLHIEKCWIAGFVNHGIHFVTCYGSKIKNTICTHNKLNGCFLTQSCNSISITDCIFNANALQEGYANLFISANETLENLQLSIMGCDFSYAGSGADATLVENYNVVIINTWGVNFKSNYLEGGDNTVTGLYIGSNTQNICVDNNYMQDCTVVFEAGLVKNSSYRYNVYQKYNSFGPTYDNYINGIFDGVNGNEFYGNFYKDAPSTFRDTRKFKRLEVLNDILTKDISVIKAGGSKLTLGNSVNSIELRADEAGAGGCEAVLRVQTTDVIIIEAVNVTFNENVTINSYPTVPFADVLKILAFSGADNKIRAIAKADFAATETNTGLVKMAAAVTDIPTPGSATAEDCANKINELMVALRTAGILTT